jgi:tetratricopeptide (TPR) repeat protein
MGEAGTDICPDDRLTELLASAQADDLEGLAAADALLLQYPQDPRLHFLKGSLLAGIQRYEEGRIAMAKAIEIAPGFELARFQLGFLEFTSGLAAEAMQSWAPFDALPEAAPFRLFATGLAHLAQDGFDECDRLLRLGIERNAEHPLINGDMQLILNEIAPMLTPGQDASPSQAAPASAAHQLLQQFELKGGASKTKH